MADLINSLQCARHDCEYTRLRLAEAERLLRAVRTNVRTVDLMAARDERGEFLYLDESIDKWLAPSASGSQS